MRFTDATDRADAVGRRMDESPLLAAFAAAAMGVAPLLAGLFLLGQAAGNHTLITGGLLLAVLGAFLLTVFAFLARQAARRSRVRRAAEAALLER